MGAGRLARVWQRKPGLTPENYPAKLFLHNLENAKPATVLTLSVSHYRISRLEESRMDPLYRPVNRAPEDRFCGRRAILLPLWKPKH
jgi:hypothetical protein